MINSLYTLEEHLNRRANESESASRLKSIYELNKLRVERYLPSILATFPHYSEHNQNHSKKIISAIEKILGENQIEKLTIGDTWLILNCAYMHDIGMIITEKETREAFRTEEFSEFLDECKASSDEDIRKAALHIKNYKEIDKGYNYYDEVLDLKRDIILLISGYYRPKHTERISEHVNNTKSQLYELFNMSFYNELPSRAQHTISKICMLHGKNFSDIIDKLPLVDTLIEFDIHPRLVAALIRIGDLCDIDNERFNLVSMACFGKLTQIDISHYFKHQTIESMHISTNEINIKADVNFTRIENEYNIKFCYEKIKINNDKVDNICFKIIKAHKDWEVWLNDEVRNLKLFWNRVGDNYIDPISLDVNYEILVNGEKNITSTKNLRFNFDKEKAFNLIEKSLYDNKMIFVRELIQNSSDAIKFQFWRDINEGNYDYALKDYIAKNKEGNKINYSNLKPFDIEDLNIFKHYKITIDAKYNEELSCGEFNINDNGIGISITDLENNILKTGRSWNERREYKDELKSMPEWLKPTGGFGIGLHSVFALTDKIKITSKSQYEKEGNNIFLSTGKNDGYAFIYKDKNIEKRGTQISFNCNEELFESNKLKGSDPFTFKLIDSFAEKVKKIVEQNFSENFFPIILNDNNMDKLIFEDDCYKGLFDKNMRNRILDSFHNTKEEFEFSFAFDGSYIAIYDKKEHLACKLGIKFNNKESVVTYKNVKVQYGVLNDEYKELNILRVDILGNDVKDVILYDRKSLNNKYKDKLKNRLKVIKKFALQIYEKLLLELFQNETFKKYNEELLQLAEKYLEAEDIENFISETNIFIKKYYNISGLDIMKRNNKNIIKTVYMQIFEHTLVQSDDKIYNLCKNIITRDSLSEVDKLSNSFMTEVEKEFKKIIKYILTMKEKKINDTLTRYVNKDNDFADKILELIGARIAQVINNELEINYTSNEFNEYNEETESTLNIAINNFLNKIGELFQKLLNVKYDPFSLNGEYTPEVNPLVNGFNNEFEKVTSTLLMYNENPNYWNGGVNSPFTGLYGFVFCRDNYWDFEGEYVLKLYNSIPIMKVVFMGIHYNLLCGDLLETVKKQLDQYSTFKINEYFHQCSNLIELINSNNAIIAFNCINGKMFYALPFLYDATWRKMYIDEGMLYLEYNMKDTHKGCIEANEKCITKYLQERVDFQDDYKNYLVIPAFSKYSDIAIDFIPIRFENFEFCNNNLVVMLWDYPGRIYEKSVAINGDDKVKEQIIEEIFQSENVQNLIRFIYTYTKNTDLDIQKIKDTYKIFIADILLSIS